MSAWTPPFGYGEKSPYQSPASSFASLSPPPSLAKELGKKWVINGNEFKLVQATVAFAIAGIQSLVCADAGTTAKTHLVAAVAGAGATIDTLAGIASPSQIALAANDYFLVQTQGRATVLAGAAGTTTHLPQICAAAGQVTDSGALTLTTFAQCVGIIHQTRTSGLAGELEIHPMAFA